jgi:hypothetical protein
MTALTPAVAHVKYPGHRQEILMYPVGCSETQCTSHSVILMLPVNVSTRHALNSLDVLLLGLVLAQACMHAGQLTLMMLLSALTHEW